MMQVLKKIVRNTIPRKYIRNVRKIFHGERYSHIGSGDILLLNGLFNNVKLNYADKKIVLIHPWKISYEKAKNSKFFDCFSNNPNIDLIINEKDWENKKHNFIDNNQDHFLFHLDIENPIFFDKWYARPIYENKICMGYNFSKNGKNALENLLINNDVPLKSLYPEVYFSNSDIKKAESIIEKHKLNKFLCLYPFPNKKVITKQWQKENWQKLVDKINDYINKNDMDMKIIYFGEKNQPNLKNVVDLRGKTSFRESVALVQKSIGVICYNGVGVHVARSVRKPCVCISSGTEIKQHIAYPNDTFVINHKTKCYGCGLYFKCDNNLECLKQISSDDVLEQVKKLISKI